MMDPAATPATTTSADGARPRAWWVASIIAVVSAVAVIAGVGVDIYLAERDLSHPEVVHVRESTGEIVGVEPSAQADNAALAAALEESAKDPRLGSFTATVVDAQSGQEVWSRNPTVGSRPASATKILTSAAALLSLDEADVLTTRVDRSADGQLVLVAGGDVSLTEDRVEELAAAVRAEVGGDIESGAVTRLALDTSLWVDEGFSADWDSADIEGGYIAPMQPVMLNGARIGASSGDVPRSTSPAADVGVILARELGVEFVGETDQSGAEAPVVAAVHSDPLALRLHTMMVHSDNIMAEAIGREVALATGHPASQVGAREATLEVLADHGIDTSGINLVDNSGLAESNSIPTSVFAQILTQTATNPQLRPLLDTLPVAGGQGSLSTRFSHSPGEGWVRAKTGTLTDTSALAGVIPAYNGHTYVFAFICNDTPVPDGRAGMDRIANLIREFS